MHDQDNSLDIPANILGILTCVSDAVIIYQNEVILYKNAEASLLLQQLPEDILQQLQFDSETSSLHQLQFSLPASNEQLSINCMATQWNGKSACIAIIKTVTDYEIFNQDYNRIGHSRNRLDLLFRSAGDGYWDWYIPTAVVFFSKGWLQMLGYAVYDIAPSFNSWIKLIHPDDLGHFLLTWASYMENPEHDFTIEYRVRCQNGTYLWVEAHAIKELDTKGNLIRLAGFHRNIEQRKLNEEKIREYQQELEQLVALRTSELEQANLQLQKLADQDPLTQLQNRRSFNDYLNKQMKLARRNNISLCLIMLDIDHFKAYNDRYGHKLGDDCLKQVATVIRESLLRPADFASRYGGEEFVIVLPDTDIQGAISVAKNIQTNLAELHRLPKNPVSEQQLTASIGIASNTQLQQQDILQLADRAMYAAKENGRNQISYFSNDLKSLSYVVNHSLL